MQTSRMGLPPKDCVTCMQSLSYSVCNFFDYVDVFHIHTRAMKCSMDELKFAATWKTSGIQGAKFSIKVRHELR